MSGKSEADLITGPGFGAVRTLHPGYGTSRPLPISQRGMSLLPTLPQSSQQASPASAGRAERNYPDSSPGGVPGSHPNTWLGSLGGCVLRASFRFPRVPQHRAGDCASLLCSCTRWQDEDGYCSISSLGDTSELYGAPLIKTPVWTDPHTCGVGI